MIPCQLCYFIFSKQLNEGTGTSKALEEIKNITIEMKSKKFRLFILYLLV